MSILRFVSVALVLLLIGCSAKILQVEKSEEVLRVDAYEKKVHVNEIKEPPVAAPPPENKSLKIVKKKVIVAKKAKAHEPSIEDGEGFSGRRPIVDPFRAGEKVTLDVSYFNMVAGTMDLEVLPFKEVNKRKAYHFQVTMKSTPFFSRIYSVEDSAVTFVDFDELMPHSLAITIKETKQLAETRTFFDWQANKASYWQKRITKDKGERSKEITWNILPYSQNVVSVAYYIRLFQWRDGKSYSVRVADEGKNIVFKAKVLRREKLQTAVGLLDTVVIKPEIEVDGAFKPVGDILIWMTDDDRKILVRLESKIKIGTIVAKLKTLDKGLGQ